VLARLAQTWFVRLPAALLGVAVLLGLLAALLVNVPGVLLTSAPAPTTPDSANTLIAAPETSTPGASTPIIALTTAEVIVPEAALYSAPGGSGAAIRTAARGERFDIVAQAEVGDLWYQVWTDAGQLWIAGFSVAVAPGGAPIPAVTVQAQAPAATATTDSLTAQQAASPTLILPSTSGPVATAAVVTPVQTACGATAQTTAVLHSGPGTAFAAVEALATGQFAILDGQVRDSGGGVWWRVQNSGLWVDASAMSGDTGCANLPFVPVTSVEPLPTPAACPDAQPRRLRVGGQARAVTSDIALARTAGGSEIVTRLAPGQEVTVIGGPVCAPLGLASVTWWEVQASPGVIGWIAEEAGGVYYFAPVG
jgi:hypothetical protein